MFILDVWYNQSILLYVGEAEAAILISQAMATAGNGLIEVRRIDTAKEVAAIIARSRNITYLPSSSGGGSNLLLSVGNDKWSS